MSTKVMDALMSFLSSLLHRRDNSIVICDTTVPANMMRQHSRFVKTAVKDRHKLKFLDEVFSSLSAALANKIYFPFNIDQHHWTDSLMKKELNPTAHMFPYIRKEAPGSSSAAPFKPFSVSRCKSIPKCSSPYDSAVMAVLLIDTHCSAGIEGCKAITLRLLPGAAKQLAVNFFNFISEAD
ncbi:hypothetical protein Bca4012_083942 [Brassica carinata]